MCGLALARRDLFAATVAQSLPDGRCRAPNRCPNAARFASGSHAAPDALPSSPDRQGVVFFHWRGRPLPFIRGIVVVAQRARIRTCFGIGHAPTVGYF